MDKIILKQIDSNSDMALIAKIYKQSGDKVSNGDLIFDVETSKTSESIYSEVDGFIEICCDEFAEYQTGFVLANIYDSIDNMGKQTETTDTIIIKPATQKAIEAAKRLNIDINSIEKDGIIKEEDVLKFSKPVVISNVFKYDRERVVIIGAGMGADVVADILLDDKNKVVVGCVDDNAKSFNYLPYMKILDCTINNFPYSIDRDYFDTVIISIVSNAKSLDFREKIYNDYTYNDIKFTNAISKDIDLRRFVTIGTGNLICSNVHIGTCTTIGNNNFISYGCSIGHHNTIGNHNLIAPGVITSGAVTIGSKCVLAAGVTTMNRLTIGDNVILPVGFNVIKDYAEGVVVK